MLNQLGMIDQFPAHEINLQKGKRGPTLSCYSTQNRGGWAGSAARAMPVCPASRGPVSQYTRQRRLSVRVAHSGRGTLTGSEDRLGVDCLPPRPRLSPPSRERRIHRVPFAWNLLGTPGPVAEVSCATRSFRWSSRPWRRMPSPGAAAGLGNPPSLTWRKRRPTCSARRAAGRQYFTASSPTATPGRRIAIRYYPARTGGGLNVFDLADGSESRDPYPENRLSRRSCLGRVALLCRTDGKRLLRRCNYLTLDVEDMPMPPDRGEAQRHGLARPPLLRRERRRRADPLHLLDRGKPLEVLDKPGYHANTSSFLATVATGC